MDGIIVLYLNSHPECNQDSQQLIDVFMRTNQLLVEQIHKDTGYRVMVVPTMKEACRVEKVDFDKPFPRYTPKTHFNLLADERRRYERDRSRPERADEPEPAKE